MRPTLKSPEILRAILLLAFLAATGQWAAGAEWRIDTVDDSGAGRFASMKIDSKGNVHVAYIPEQSEHPLKYAYWDHILDRWFTMPVAKYASFCTLAVDSKQRPHISFVDQGSGKGAKLRYARWEGEG